MQHERDREKQKELNKLLRESRLEREANSGRQRSKIIESKPNNRQNRRKIKQQLNQIIYNGIEDDEEI